MIKNNSAAKPQGGKTAPKPAAKLATQAPLETQSVLAFMRQNGFTQYNANIGVNVNDYPFVTFINADNEAENVYFSKNAAEQISADEAVNGQFLARFVIVDTVNAEGEARTKLSLRGGNRGSINDLEMAMAELGLD
jgi:hypothetical protein